MSKVVIPESYQALIASSRVSKGTRAALTARAAFDNPGYQPVALTQAQLAILRAVMRRVLPQPGDAELDLAARLDAQLGDGTGDGWRFALLPADRIAYARGLATLESQATSEHRVGFADLSDDLQDALLARAAAGELGGGLAEHPDTRQMQLWFEDVRGDLVKLYMAHPATLARLGYSGIAYGGDGTGKPGFTQIGLGEREPWEPVAATR